VVVAAVVVVAVVDVEVFKPAETKLSNKMKRVSNRKNNNLKNTWNSKKIMRILLQELMMDYFLSEKLSNDIN
jgi:hypothetical protein